MRDDVMAIGFEAGASHMVNVGNKKMFIIYDKL